MMYVLNSPSFHVILSGQNSVKILTNPYAWKHCRQFVYIYSMLNITVRKYQILLLCTFGASSMPTEDNVSAQ